MSAWMKSPILSHFMALKCYVYNVGTLIYLKLIFLLCAVINENNQLKQKKKLYSQVLFVCRGQLPVSLVLVTMGEIRCLDSEQVS